MRRSRINVYVCLHGHVYVCADAWVDECVCVCKIYVGKNVDTCVPAGIRVYNITVSIAIHIHCLHGPGHVHAALQDLLGAKGEAPFVLAPVDARVCVDG